MKLFVYNLWYLLSCVTLHFEALGTLRHRVIYILWHTTFCGTWLCVFNGTRNSGLQKLHLWGFYNSLLNLIYLVWFLNPERYRVKQVVDICEDEAKWATKSNPKSLPPNLEKFKIMYIMFNHNVNLLIHAYFARADKCWFQSISWLQPNQFAGWGKIYFI